MYGHVPPTHLRRRPGKSLDLLHRLTSHLSPSNRKSLAKLIRLVRAYFAEHDASHDFAHVTRVVRNAALILDREEQRSCDKVERRCRDVADMRDQARGSLKPSQADGGKERKGGSSIGIPSKEKSWARKYDALLVLVGALVHDVGDRKYQHLAPHVTSGRPPKAAKSSSPSNTTPQRPQSQSLQITAILNRCSFTDAFVQQVTTLVSAILYSTEVSNPSQVTRTIERVPETAIVQDADRLDALGSIGIARCLIYSTSKSSTTLKHAGVKAGAGGGGGGGGGRSRSASKTAMIDALSHFYDKLLKLTLMMKTTTAKKEARRRTRLMGRFVREFEREI